MGVIWHPDVGVPWNGAGGTPTQSSRAEEGPDENPLRHMIRSTARSSRLAGNV
jgi:hypothetical protein